MRVPYGGRKVGKGWRCVMLGEKVLGQEASYLRRLGAQCALLCGVATVFGAAAYLAAPSADTAWATALAAAIAACGAVLARR